MLGFLVVVVGVIFQLFYNLANANPLCSILPIDSYDNASNIYTSLEYKAEKNATEIATILSLKQYGEYKAMFEGMKEIAHETSHPQALYNLGQFYRQGIGTSINIDFAIESYFEAASRGSDKAAVNIALLIDDAVRSNHIAIPTLLVPLSKEYSLYWLLTAQRMSESAVIAKSLDSITQKRLQDPVYLTELKRNYPNFYNKENPYQKILDSMNSFQSNFKVTFKKNTDLE
ncbi:MAG: SEL1-like repeat protein, partial [Bdellovibrionales bacterium]|nr:SEL1-like repeat protein [Bdellovibrionales bacterium]